MTLNVKGKNKNEEIVYTFFMLRKNMIFDAYNLAKDYFDTFLHQ